MISRQSSDRACYLTSAASKIFLKGVLCFTRTVQAKMNNMNASSGVEGGKKYTLSLMLHSDVELWLDVFAFFAHR